MEPNEEQKFICQSGAVFYWTLDEGNGTGVVGGYFNSKEPVAGADIEEVKLFLRTQVPDGGRTVFEKVLAGPSAVVRQQALAIRDQLLGRGCRN